MYLIIDEDGNLSFSNVLLPVMVEASDDGMWDIVKFSEEPDGLQDGQYFQYINGDWRPIDKFKPEDYVIPED